MMLFIQVLLIALLSLVALSYWHRQRQLRRERFIRSQPWPTGLLDRLGQRRPTLSPSDRALVADGLRQFFLAYHLGGHRHLSMPSQVVDDLWHEFILYTRHYERFCQAAFGRFLHHTPAVALGPAQQNNAGLRRCWFWCCRQEGIDPQAPERLPLLFALDARLGIGDGFFYVPDCRALQTNDTGTMHCAADLGSGDGADGCDSSDSGDGGGCGGD